MFSASAVLYQQYRVSPGAERGRASWVLRADPQGTGGGDSDETVGLQGASGNPHSLVIGHLEMKETEQQGVFWNPHTWAQPSTGTGTKRVFAQVS